MALGTEFPVTIGTRTEMNSNSLLLFFKEI